MTIREIYRSYLSDLQNIYSLNEATIILDWMFESIASIRRSDLVKTPMLLLPAEINIKLEHSFNQLLQHKPIQYVLGEAWFYNFKLKVNEHVLIPRPETEELVTLVIDHCSKSKKANQQITILDIGTGSGCIAIALGKNLPHAAITALDLSLEALEISKENAMRHQVHIEFTAFDFLEENLWHELPVFDVIVSNPPYIPVNEKDKLDLNVAVFEPPGALFVPEDLPMLFYEKIAYFGKKHLAAGGAIFVEVHEDFSNETLKVFTKSYSSATIKNDLFGKQRMVIASNHLPGK